MSEIDPEKYPHLAKMSATHPLSQAVHDFLEWCSEQGLELGEWTESGRYLRPTLRSEDELLAAHFDLDLKATERERVALLAEARQLPEPKG